MRLVDADEAKKYLYEHLDDLHMIAAQNAIDEMPTIDAQPVKHGKWVKVDGKYGGNFGCKCNNCGKRIRYGNSIPKNSKCFYWYCPNCGAYMGGDTDGDENCRRGQEIS